jgi:outer membrane cobalamin receptor
LAGGAAPADADHDGMSDVWEQAHGFDTHNPADGKADADNDGYTNLEEYLHSLTE